MAANAKQPDRESLPYRPCAGVMVINPAGLIFTAQRFDAPGAWQMPQGGIDDGENPAVAALRELHEETGMTSVEILGEAGDWHTYELPDHLLGKALKGRYRGQRQKWFAVRFTGADDEVNLELHEPEFSAWRWSTTDQVIADIVDFKRDLYRSVLADLAGHIAPA